MCGISGFFYLDGRPLSEGEDLPILRAMADAIRYRGPDDRQYLLWRNVGIAFNRLSIVDVEGGQQPFHTPDGHVSAVVNGEIYNHAELRSRLTHHSLASRSDCEVVPYLYLEHGHELFDDVNGMFAAAVLDRRSHRLLLARDRLGIKPLFYCHLPSRNLFVFASELKALFAHPAVPRRFDWSAALTRGVDLEVPGQERPSCFLGIERVPAGCVMDVSLADGSMRRHPYWQVPEGAHDAGSRGPGDYVEEYRELLRDSVRKRLMSDVPFGVFLSSGIDSTIVTALAAQSAEFPTFSVLSQSTIANGDAAGAHATCQHLGLPNHQVHFDLETLQVDPEDWRRLLWHCELYDVTAEQLHKFYLHQFAKRAYPDLKVILLGQGSDEFTGGYMEWLVGGAPPWGPEAWERMDAALRERFALAHGYRRGISFNFVDLVKRGVMAPSFVCDWQDAHPRADTWRLYTSYCRTNLDYHLWHEDRTSSAHSIESRVPFLDHRLIELLARIPPEHQAALFTDKRIVRLAAEGIVPPDAVARPKRYFFYGEGEQHTLRMLHALLARDGGALVEQAIEGSERSDGPFDGEALRRFAAEVARKPERLQSTRLLSLVNMGVLAHMALHQREPRPGETALTVREVSDSELLEKLGHAGEGEPSTDLERAVLDFPPQCTLIEVHRSGADTSLDGHCFISCQGQLVPLTSPTWVAFLRMLDGVRSVPELVEAGGLNRSRIQRHVEEALAQGLLAVKGYARSEDGAHAGS